MQPSSAEKRRLRRKASRVARRLRAVYGSPRHGNKDDPLDELVFIVLSQMTTQASHARVYDRLKAEAGSWERARHWPLRKLRSLIKHAGLSHQKAPRLREIFRRAEKDFGRVTLGPLRKLPDNEAEDYLVSLPGVGPKTAKCVMMYSLGRKVLPVDTHVWRIAKRMGLVSAALTYPKVHETLEAVVSPGDRYSFHVNGIAHGREVCIAKMPRCHACVLVRHCPTGEHTVAVSSGSTRRRRRGPVA